MRGRWLPVVAAVVVVIAVGVPVALRLAGGSCSGGDPDGNAGGPVNTSTVPASASASASASAEEYWTPERKASARPVQQPDSNEVCWGVPRGRTGVESPAAGERVQLWQSRMNSRSAGTMSARLSSLMSGPIGPGGEPGRRLSGLRSFAGLRTLLTSRTPG